MSASEADRFIAAVKASPEQFADFEQYANAGAVDEAYAQVRAMGYDATQAEIREAFLEYASEHLSDDQLAAVAGGLSDGQIGGLAGAGVAIVAVVSIAAAAAA